MTTIYTKEDYLLYLLSGGDTEPMYKMVRGPTSHIPLTKEDALEFLDQVNAVSGKQYFIPRNFLILYFCADSANNYWLDRGELTQYPNIDICDNNDTAYVILCRRIG